MTCSAVGPIANSRCFLRTTILLIAVMGNSLAGFAVLAPTPVMAQPNSTCGPISLGETQNCTMPEAEDPVDLGSGTIHEEGRCPGNISITVDYGDGTKVDLPLPDCGGTVHYPSHVYHLEEGDQIRFVRTAHDPGWPDRSATHIITIVEGDMLQGEATKVVAYKDLEISQLVGKFKNLTIPQHTAGDFEHHRLG